MQAKASQLFEFVGISSDSPQILEIAKEWGADYLIQRPTELASDQAAKLPAIQHCAQKIEQLSKRTFDVFVDLDATSPLRNVEDIRGSVQLLEERGVPNVITGTPARRSPYFNLVEMDENGAVHLAKKTAIPIVRRQDAPKCYDLNASIYVWTRQALFESPSVIAHDTRLYVMPEDRSIDIDSELDFEWVTFLMKKQSNHHVS